VGSLAHTHSFPETSNALAEQCRTYALGETGVAAQPEGAEDVKVVQEVKVVKVKRNESA
jgi:Ser-tRNA(Ala) deacylase AlaX